MSFSKINTYLGWFVFLIATSVYFITLEDTVSLWDCGEYVTAAYKLEVGHPPGAPLFMVLGRLFSFFAAPEDVAVWINRLSAVSSGLTILFMFWSSTLLLKKIALMKNETLSKGAQWAIFGSGIVGSLAYTFSESFWFSAVEGEVYAMSSLFTAAIFWAILKWDEEMSEMRKGLMTDMASPNRWLLLIMFLLGLAIGVHLLGILVVPAICYVIYFNHQQKVSAKGIVLVGILSIIILGFIQEGVIPGSISLASAFEVTFVNSLGMPFFYGTIFFFAALVVGCYALIVFARRSDKPILYNATMGLIMLLIGYGSFAVIVIRSNANTPLDENDPENLVTLRSYLKREQYGSAPILSGPYWNSKENTPDKYDGMSPFYLRRFVVSKGENDIKAFKSEALARKYAAENAGTVTEKYYESNASVRENSVPTYAQTTIFPRMYWSQEQAKVDGYIRWSGYDANDGTGTEIGKDGKRLPSFKENMRYFFSYQMNWMYFRYFMWNFAGRQNDIQGHGDAMRGNWISGISEIDDARLGDQSNAPYFTTENPAHNVFFFLPLVLGLIGMFFHFYRAPKDAFVVLLAFLFTGLAIVVYLNQKPFEPRERDYAYAGSFYFFALWIAVGVYALYDAFVSFTRKDVLKMLSISGGVLLLFLALDASSEVSMPNTLSWLVISGVSIGAVLFMIVLRNVIKSDQQGAIIASILGLSVPLIMGIQGWDDHDRSLKTTARDLAENYLESCAKEGIIFTNGDNDTFPLWYLQEVEGKRTDVRVCNLSLLQTDWYTEQMKMRAYDSDPLPIKFSEDQTLMYAGNTDQVAFIGLFDMFAMNASEATMKEVVEMRLKNNRPAAIQALTAFNSAMGPISAGISSADPSISSRLEQVKSLLIAAPDSNLTQNVMEKYRAALEIYAGANAGYIKLGEGQIESFQSALAGLEKNWSAVDLDDAMKFVRNDKNLLTYNEQLVRVFPSTSFIMKVEKENAVKSGLITAAQKADCLPELRFEFESNGLTREQVMMMDILANNDWKRGIYFSSPGGSDVSMALYSKGYIKQNGMAFELSPLSNLNDRYAVSMYDNLMGLYKYGEMNNPDVLTDYYARRHTSQYRMHYASLAEYYLNRIEDQADLRKQVAQMKSMGMANEQIKNFERDLLTDKEIADYKKRVSNLINHSLEVMPAEFVIDGGEPNQGRDAFQLQGVTLNGYDDGLLHDYVAMLYRSGDKKSAEKLGDVVASQLESVITYYLKSDVRIALRRENTKDLYAALGAYFKLHMASISPDFGNKKGKLASRTQAFLKMFYSSEVPRLLKELEKKAQENGENVQVGGQSGLYPAMYTEFKDYTQAIGAHFGFIRMANVPQSPVDTGGEDMSLDALLESMPKQDSVLK